MSVRAKLRSAISTSLHELLESLSGDPGAASGIRYDVRYYNLERSHQGNRLKRRTPAWASMEALAVIEIPDIIPTEEVSEPPPTAA